MNGAPMNTLESNKLHINVSAISNTATIYLSGNFTFDAHRDFKAAYKNHLTDSKINNIVVDLEKIHYLDSSALGMLLALRDQVQAVSKSLILSRPSLISTRVFNIANFHKLFVIN